MENVQYEYGTVPGTGTSTIKQRRIRHYLQCFELIQKYGTVHTGTYWL